MRRGKIAVIGSYNRDVGMVVDRFPSPGETCQAVGVFESHGGKGSNQASQAAKFDVDVAMIAAVGEDTAGRAALALWQGEGIDVSGAVQVPGARTGMAVVLVETGGQNLIVVDAAANAQLDETAVRSAQALFADADLVLAQLETPIPATRLAFEIARASRATTVLNAAPLQASLPADLLDLVDILIVNEVEAGQLAAHLGAVGDLEAAAEQLLGHVRQAVVLTLGAEGVVLFESGSPIYRLAAPRVDLVDSTGAGDAFTGAFAARWVKTQNARDATRWGAAAGAYACSSRGAAASYGGPADLAGRHGVALGLDDD